MESSESSESSELSKINQLESYYKILSLQNESILPPIAQLLNVDPRKGIDRIMNTESQKLLLGPFVKKKL